MAGARARSERLSSAEVPTIDALRLWLLLLLAAAGEGLAEGPREAAGVAPLTMSLPMSLTRAAYLGDWVEF